MAILYQAITAPVIDGVRKPMKAGGYADSGADIAFALRASGVAVLTPVPNPRPDRDLDWVFPDTTDGIAQAAAKGARALWANTILFDQHPLTRVGSRFRMVGQPANLVQIFDDKWEANSRLRAAGLPVAASTLVGLTGDDGVMGLDELSPEKVAEAGLQFPLVVKPIRGRGSQGVAKVEDLANLIRSAGLLLTAKTRVEEVDYLTYGTKLILEEFLHGDEITVTVMPPGNYVNAGNLEVHREYWPLPLVERFNHRDGIAPYSGVVAVVENSAVMSAERRGDPAGKEISRACVNAAKIIHPMAPIRIDCRRTEAGNFLMFDTNMKPNMTGPGRPGREHQDSLTGLAARAIGWSYRDLLVNILGQAW